MIICNACSPIDFKSTVIWDNSPHNAFTSLIHYKSELYLVFREGNHHVDRKGGDDGRIRIIKTKDGKHWRSLQKIQMSGYDLRDPELVESPDGNLFIYFVAATYQGGRPTSYHTYYSKMVNGSFQEPYKIITPINHNWIWKIHWINGKAYGFNYINTFDLLSSSDGFSFDIVKSFNLSGKPTEADFVTNGDSVLVVVNRDNEKGLIGKGILADGNIKWETAGSRFAGPMLFRLNSEITLFLTTEYVAPRTLGLKIYKIKGTDFHLLGTLPASADCGYMGAAVFKDQLYISYYSTVKTGKVAIYLSTIPLSKIL